MILFDDTQILLLDDKSTVNGTVALKAKFLRNSGIGGVLVQYIDMDDFTGSWCSIGKYPITNVVSKIIRNGKENPSSDASSYPVLPQRPNQEITSTTTTVKPSEIPSVPSNQNALCENIRTTDLIPDPVDCRFYFVCTPQFVQPVAHLQCPNGTIYSPSAKTCQKQETSVSIYLENQLTKASKNISSHSIRYVLFKM